MDRSVSTLFTSKKEIRILDVTENNTREDEESYEEVTGAEKKMPREEVTEKIMVTEKRRLQWWNTVVDEIAYLGPYDSEETEETDEMDSSWDDSENEHTSVESEDENFGKV